MLARLLGLTAVCTAAAIGIAAQVVIVPTYYVVELKRRRLESHWDWDTTPVFTASERSERAA